VGMGVIPLQFKEGESWQTLGLDGTETIDIAGVETIEPRAKVSVRITRANGDVLNVETLCRIDTANELDYYKNGGILHYVLRSLVAA
jgi:aconitate hydratase